MVTCRAASSRTRLREVVEDEVEVFLRPGKNSLLYNTSGILRLSATGCADRARSQLEHGEGGGTSTVAAPVLLNVVVTTGGWTAEATVTTVAPATDTTPGDTATGAATVAASHKKKNDQICNQTKTDLQ